jgi:hypothetical protein
MGNRKREGEMPLKIGELFSRQHPKNTIAWDFGKNMFVRDISTPALTIRSSLGPRL